MSVGGWRQSPCSSAPATVAVVLVETGGGVGGSAGAAVKRGDGGYRAHGPVQWLCGPAGGAAGEGEGMHVGGKDAGVQQGAAAPRRAYGARGRELAGRVSGVTTTGKGAGHEALPGTAQPCAL